MRPLVLSVSARVLSVSVPADLCACLCLFVYVCCLYVYACPLASPIPPGRWPNLRSCGSLTSVRRPPAAAPKVAHCLPVVRTHSPDSASSIYCCHSFSSGGKAGAVISSKADAVSVERMGCQRGQHPSPQGPNVSPPRFSIWQGSSSPEVIPQLGSPVLNYSVK